MGTDHAQAFTSAYASLIEICILFDEQSWNDPQHEIVQRFDSEKRATKISMGDNSLDCPPMTAYPISERHSPPMFIRKIGGGNIPLSMTVAEKEKYAGLI